MNFALFINKLQNKKKGFTLIELLVGISIIAILGTIGFTTYSQSQLRARDFKRKQDLRSIATGLELFYQQYKRYPCSGNGNSLTSKNNWDLSASGGTSWLKDTGSGNCSSGGSDNDFAPTYINELPIDPSNNVDDTPNKNNWQGYAYYSTSNSLNTCTAGTYYILVTRLENPNDQDRLGGTGSLSICGTTVNLHADSFVVSDP